MTEITLHVTLNTNKLELKINCLYLFLSFVFVFWFLDQAIFYVQVLRNFTRAFSVDNGRLHCLLVQVFQALIIRVFNDLGPFLADGKSSNMVSGQSPVSSPPGSSPSSISKSSSVCCVSTTVSDTGTLTMSLSMEKKVNFYMALEWFPKSTNAALQQRCVHQGPLPCMTFTCRHTFSIHRHQILRWSTSRLTSHLSI